jgi:cytochrome c-type biogenesis protein CcmE
MKTGPLVTALVAVLAMSAVVTAFMSNASPYVTVAEARDARGDRLHLAGDILKETVQNDFSNRTLKFSLRDEEGAVVTIVHRGDPPANMGEATKVVAIGKMDGEQFVSDKLLVKCPSKYETEK